MNKIITLSLIVLTSCYHQSKERDVYSAIPRGENPDTEMVIVEQIHTVTGEATISRKVDGRFDRTDKIIGDVLVEIDTLKRHDKLVIVRESNDEVETLLNTTVYRSDTLLKTSWVRSTIYNTENTRTYILD